MSFDSILPNFIMLSSPGRRQGFHRVYMHMKKPMMLKDYETINDNGCRW